MQIYKERELSPFKAWIFSGNSRASSPGIVTWHFYLMSTDQSFSLTIKLSPTWTIERNLVITEEA
jgi:hypothetical protein